ncbi:helix-turn-helix transcriptional regulator [Streptomyces sp. SM14]|uniref:ArsR/SmtB family transcription factor n=1 Tax=Streptomyces sp. SM14 TaxID=1736045 RepID=UPI0021565286|nr:metalloregulator ArsR/SmtB family transcription factor [Streptomyces sp. SM14]
MDEQMTPRPEPPPSAGAPPDPADQPPPSGGLSLDLAFAALADPVRRAVVARLSRGPATVLELAEPFAISTQAVSRHIQVLERAGLVTRTREAQRRPVHLAPAALEELTSWIDGYRLLHEQRYRRLDEVLGAPRAGTGSTGSTEQGTERGERP